MGMSDHGCMAGRSARTDAMSARSWTWTRSTPASEITTSPVSTTPVPKQPVQEVDERDAVVTPDVDATSLAQPSSATSSTAKEYGAHGPATSSSTPGCRVRRSSTVAAEGVLLGVGEQVGAVEDHPSRHDPSAAGPAGRAACSPATAQPGRRGRPRPSRLPRGRPAGGGCSARACAGGTPSRWSQRPRAPSSAAGFVPTSSAA